ncbi:MAG: 3-oxoacyl-[acyl-carrier-protein] reductase [Lachnospiraceae bacterium]|nr:3-oxoacyl-[acyl-carrier-protein] reductase [Lachnospiraceae bacterium]
MSEGRTAVITGGSRGIGAAIANRLARDGADIALIATKDSESARKTVESIRALGRKCEFFACNVADEAECSATAGAILEEFGSVDILVNNAGITNDKLMVQMKEDDFSKVLEVNLLGAYHMSKAFLRSFMRKKSGRIINISSVVGLMGNAGQTNYAASKAGLIGLTKSMAKEYAAKGITVNAIAPGYIETAMTGAMTDGAAEKILESIPLKRAGSPEDVANLAAFLAQDETSYITGEVIKVDGGMYI